MNSVLFSSDKDCWETPKELFEKLDSEFHFTLDPCSTHENAKCAKHYTQEDDGLSKSWGGERVFCNPPYGRDLKKWVRKAYQAIWHPDTLVVMLIPARTDTAWFQEYILHRAEVRFLPGRVRFEINGEKKGNSTFPSMVVIFRSGGMKAI